MPERTERLHEPGVRTLRQPNRKPLPAEIDELVKRYQAGMDMTALGRQFGMHRQTVRTHLLRRDVELRPQWTKLSHTQLASAAELYEAGSSTYQLGKQFGVGPDVIRRALIGRGVGMRPRGLGASRSTNER